MRCLLSATRVAKLSCGLFGGWEIILGVVCAAARRLVSLINRKSARRSAGAKLRCSYRLLKMCGIIAPGNVLMFEADFAFC